MSLPGGLCNRTVDTLVDRLGAKEVTGPDGGPFQVLGSVMGPDPVGSVRIWTSEKVAKIVYIGVVVPQIGLDSHMVFAFGHEDSPIPHFTLDSVAAGGHLAFHLDLIQRVDAGIHMVYNDWAHTPISAAFEELNTLEGLSKAQLEPRQLTVMSSWMVANRATPEAFEKLDGPVNAYLEHWLSLVDSEVPAAVLADIEDTNLAVRDAKNRALLFSADVDKVWAQMTRLLGEETSEKLRLQLASNQISA
ncbi:hypothetical protein KG112_01260 [Nocardioides sp. zg-ZUI104]|uniref:hypothetical protein n=1 Tax=Nocardioides faecalis TaxID=2803858 RepID=UPI001BD042A8|nr:hypothetical protein [Nocardioides faecalis]MBS4751432.1 hypothetical protein [Nocardioides faecalis]